MKVKFKGDDNETMYNMIPYKSKVIQVEYGILYFSPIRKNRNAYPSKENNCGDEYILFLVYDKHLGNTTIVENIDLGVNIIL